MALRLPPDERGLISAVPIPSISGLRDFVDLGGPLVGKDPDSLPFPIIVRKAYLAEPNVRFTCCN